MKSKKKMLLALGAMSAAAIGAGATSTFAWFVTAQSATISAAGTPSGSLNVGETAGQQLTLTAKIHFDVGAAQKNPSGSSAGALGAGTVLLTQWGKADALSIDGDSTNNTRLLTAYKNGASATPTYKALNGTTDVGWIYYPVRAWIEDTSDQSEKDKGDHVNVWKEAVNSLTTNNGASVKFTYSHTIGDESESPDTTLGDNEVYMYKVDGNTAPTSYNKTGATDTSANTIGNTGLTFTVDGKDLTASNVDIDVPTTDTNKKVIGFLVLRIDGNQRNHVHNTSYSATIGSASSVVTVARS